MSKSLSIFLSVATIALLIALIAYVVPQRTASNTNEAIASANPSSDTAPDTAPSDRLAHPPERQSFTNGPYQLTIFSTDSWQTPTAMGTLESEDTQLWQQTLPHQYGPKFALVTPSGQTILFDEYINVASDYAIALIAPSGETTVTYSFDDIHQALQENSPDIARADLPRQATAGWWMAAAPTLNATSTHALVKTGGTTLQIDLTSGQLLANPLIDTAP
ncbi:MAG: hypothetical protein AAF703_14815 [Cyanobacteria bacterium P01_D01_bin.105]